MATRADLERQSQAQRDVVALATAALLAEWDAQDLSDPAAVQAALVPVFAEVVASYGELAAGLSADFFDDMREAAGVPGRFSARLADVVGAEQAEASARWALSALRRREFTLTEDDGEEITVVKEPDPEKALERLSGAAQRHVRQPGRDTITENAGRDNARWARVPTGDSTCAFCRILASRADDEGLGGVYASERSALYREDGGKYHDWCDCKPIPIWSPTDYPEGYDPNTYLQQYVDAAKVARSLHITDIAAAMREQLGVS